MTTREHGLMMTGPNVLAILERRKTHTRRVCTANNSMIDGGATGKKLWARLRWGPKPGHVDPGPSPAGNPGPYWKVPMDPAPNEDGTPGPVGWRTTNRVYPRIRVGDTIWLRETWQAHPGVIKASAGTKTSPGRVYYKANESPGACPQRWRSPMLMPRWASRISMVVTEVKAERVQDISEYDVEREGIERYRCPECGYDVFDAAAHLDHQLCKGPQIPTLAGQFKQLWESINGKTPGKAWRDNPPVWAYCWEEIKT